MAASSVQRPADVEPLLFFSGLVPDDVRNRGEADEPLQSRSRRGNSMLDRRDGGWLRSKIERVKA